jgi:hypothetical protein
MTVTITYTGATPTIDADEDTWGQELNDDALTPIKADLDALAAQVNASASLASDALPKGGGLMTGDQVLYAGGPGDARSSGYRGAPVVEFSEDKTLALSDAGCCQRLIGSTARTLTIPPVGTVGFPVGTAIPLRNSTGVVLTIARGSGVTLTLVGSATNANASLAARGQAVLFQEASNNWTLSGIGIS